MMHHILINKEKKNKDKKMQNVTMRDIFWVQFNETNGRMNVVLHILYTLYAMIYSHWVKNWQTMKIENSNFQRNKIHTN